MIIKVQCTSVVLSDMGDLVTLQPHDYVTSGQIQFRTELIGEFVQGKTYKMTIEEETT